MPIYLGEFIFVFSLGLITAFLASAPIGPVNLYLANYLLTKPSKAVRKYIIGVITADLTYITLASGAYFFWLKGSPLTLSPFWSIFSGIFIIILGLITLFKNQIPFFKQNELPPILGNHSDFGFGLIVCGSNVLLLVFWGFMSSVLVENGLEINTLGQFLIWLAGILSGDVLWFSGFVWFLQPRLNKLSLSWTQRLQYVIAFSLIVVGLLTACR
jgi:threonine/homoserine/homoserine lactone efflux protein